MAFGRVYKYLQERKERAESGKYNCIPFPFPRFRTLLPGVERGSYIVLTAGQKCGKSKLSDFLFVYELVFFVVDVNPDFKFKVLYFTLEMSPDSKYIEFLCHLLYRLDGLVVSTTDLMSTNNERPIPDYILDKINSEKYQKYIKVFEESVEYLTVSNPTGKIGLEI